MMNLIHIALFTTVWSVFSLSQTLSDVSFSIIEYEIENADIDSIIRKKERQQASSQYKTYQIGFTRNNDSDMLGEIKVIDGGQSRLFLSEAETYFGVKSYQTTRSELSDFPVIFECDNMPLAIAKKPYDRQNVPLEAGCAAEIPAYRLSEQSKKSMPDGISDIRILQSINQSIRHDTIITDDAELGHLLDIETRTTETLQYRKNGNWSNVDQSSQISELVRNSQRREYQLYIDNYQVPKLIVNQADDDSGKYKVRKINAELKAKENSLSSRTSRNSIIVQPNPSFGEAYFMFQDCLPGEYKVEILNVIGKTIYERSVYVEKDVSILFDLGFLPRGTYLYSVLDENGKKLQTRRLIIMSL